MNKGGLRRPVFWAGLVLALGLVGLFAASAGASTVPYCGETLIKSVKLTGDMNCSSGSALIVGEPKLTINLNGHTIYGNDSATTGIDNTDGYDKLTVKNGTIDGFTSYGIYVNAASGQNFKNLTIIGEGSASGIELDYSSASTVKNVTVNGGGTAFYLLVSSDNTVTNNTVNATSDTSYGFYDYGYATACGDSGGNVYKNNTVNGYFGTTYGFYIEYTSSATLKKNTANGGEEGFYLYSDECGTMNVQENSAQGNDSYGFDSEYNYSGTSGSLFKKNVSAHNDSYGFASEDDYYSTWTKNDSSYNDSQGFDFEDPAYVSVTKNTATGNDSYGFYIYGTPPNTKTVSNNTAVNNADYGFYSNDSWQPGGGNFISGNEYGCYQVTCIG